MTDKSSGRTSLTRFKDRLRVPPILRPYKTDDQRYNLRIHMRPAHRHLHSELPPSEVWTYEDLLQGRLPSRNGSNDDTHQLSRVWDARCERTGLERYSACQPWGNGLDRGHLRWLHRPLHVPLSYS